MSKKVLICDDDLHILRAAEFKLRRAGFDVRCANDGQEAWEAIQEELPDILITDCQMPRLDGISLAQRLREREETADLPIIMLTAKGFELPHERLDEQWRIATVLSKPFSPRELLQCVQQVIETGHYEKTQVSII